MDTMGTQDAASETPTRVTTTNALIRDLQARVEALEAENAQLRRSPSGAPSPAIAQGGVEDDAPISLADVETSRRRVLGTAAVGVAAAVAGTLAWADPAAATTGTMSYGTTNNAVGDSTTLQSTNSTTTLSLSNTGTGAGLTSSAGNGTGVVGQSTSGTGVAGTSGGGGAGVYGTCGTTTGLQEPIAGVSADSDSGVAIYGQVNSGIALYATASTTGTGMVVQTNSGNAIVAGTQSGNYTIDAGGATIAAIRGTLSDAIGAPVNAAILGDTQGHNAVVGVSGTANGLNGTSTSGAGAAGTSSSGAGTTGTSTSGTGAAGTSTNGVGVLGKSGSSDGVLGQITNSDSHGNAVHGTTTGSGFAGLFEITSSTTTAAAVKATGDHAQLLLAPATPSRPAPPTDTRAHTRGELVLDGSGDLWVCTASGTPGTWRKVGGPATAGAFHLLSKPVRVYDSRPGFSPSTGPKAPLTGGTALVIDTTLSSSGVPAGATGVMVNLLLVNAVSGNGNFTVWANGTSQPLANSMVWGGSTGRVSSLAVTGVDPTGKCQVLSSIQTDLAFDVVGYYR